MYFNFIPIIEKASDRHEKTYFSELVKGYKCVGVGMSGIFQVLRSLSRIYWRHYNNILINERTD